MCREDTTSMAMCKLVHLQLKQQSDVLQTCGTRIWDDFTEMQPGGLHRYRQALNLDKDEVWEASRGDSQNTARSRGMPIAAVGLRWIKDFLGLSKREAEGDLPLHTIQPAPSTETGYGHGTSTPCAESLFLLLCYDEGRWATRLMQLDLVTVHDASDQALFRILRYNYESIRGKWRSRFSLRTLSWIKFVHFELYGNEFVDIRKTDDIPPTDHAEYRYSPAPPDVMPPIGYKRIMHLYHHPEHAGAHSICLSRFPKKLKEKLRCCPIQGVNPGWGLQFVEGWDERKIWIIVFIIFVLGSLLVAMMLLIFGRSLQDAFSVAAYMATTTTVTVGFAHAFLP